MSDFNIKEELSKLPNKPGVYIMHKIDGEVIYVGKAKNLKNRVRQYFNPSYKKTDKIELMVSNIDNFEYIVVDNELEALILESNFIKEYRPKYNTLLKDDKNYPYIKITTYEEFPRVISVHRKSDDNSKYFGPYKSMGIISNIFKFIKENYKIRLCKTLQKKECLYYHLNMCLAPCINKNIKDEYKNEISNIISLLSGDTKELINDLTKKMMDSSENEDFEKAIIYRDKINNINEINERQKIENKNDNNKDILGLYRNNNIAVIQIFEMRDGNIIDRNTNILNIDINDTDSEILESFIKQYYNQTYFLPNEIWLPCEIEEFEIINKWLNRDKKKVNLVIPKIGDNDKLVKLASANAKIQYDQKIKKYLKESENINNAIDTLSKITGINNIYRFESYDISNTAGNLNVASMVVWEGNGFKKNEYRKFRMKNVTSMDDYSSMEEVIDRRLNRYINNDDKFINLPSIFLIDGGLGQVNVVKKVLERYLLDIPVIGMVKDDHHNTRGLIYEDYEIDLKNYKELFWLISKIQDETHRFAIEYHKSIRSKEQVHSVLDEIKGIGQKRKLALLKNYSNIDDIKNSDPLEIAKIDGFNIKIANEIINYLNRYL